MKRANPRYGHATTFETSGLLMTLNLPFPPLSQIQRNLTLTQLHVPSSRNTDRTIEATREQNLRPRFTPNDINDLHPKTGETNLISTWVRLIGPVLIASSIVYLALEGTALALHVLYGGRVLGPFKVESEITEGDHSLFVSYHYSTFQPNLPSVRRTLAFRFLLLATAVSLLGWNEERNQGSRCAEPNPSS